ncbi:histidine kinase [Georgenia sp. TF02-10]|uniref:sensor histidine kinase n=1 Tax=Georgenia sp. TF02-10 TaxID=2917725 RepID=UPI001FA7D425|nr:histidine kinase [Georgenia sp. TF02-10]UNX53261.1 histidine kinase [Georgenia sp. TF02-10]
MNAPSRCGGPFLTWFARHPGPWFALAWLPVLLLAPLVTAVGRGDLGNVMALAGVAALFVATAVLRYRGAPWGRTELLVAALTLAVAAYLVGWTDDQAFLYPLLAIAMATGIRRWRALSFVAALSISGAITTGFTAGSLDDALVFGFAAFMAGASTYLIGYLVETTAELDATRGRLASVAVAEERRRFSRDLHDLLGHTLSVIVVKAEAVRRFARTDPDAVAEHARGIEDIGRTALAEVRQTVAGHRNIGLEDELANAEHALAGAGIRVRAPEPPALPRDVDRLFAWVVREGTTNVLRHAGAASCEITVAVEADEATIEVVDDGRGGRSGRTGTGLAGLRERAQRLGGVLVAEGTGRGFRLGVTVPTGGAR